MYDDDLDNDLSQFEDWPVFVEPQFDDAEVGMQVCNELPTSQARRQCKEYILTSAIE